MAAYLPLLAILLVISLQDAVPVKTLTRDANQIPGVSVLTGALSSLGVLIWCATVAVCLFTSAALPGRPAVREVKTFLLVAGLFTALLMLDDLFLVHEVVLPAHFLVPEAVTMALYGLAALILLARYRAVILNTEFIPLLLALLFFGASILFDLSEDVLSFFADSRDNLGFLIEDGGKVFGIASWFVYFSRVSYLQLRFRDHS